jgi:hypothetical protein
VERKEVPVPAYSPIGHKLIGSESAGCLALERVDRQLYPMPNIANLSLLSKYLNKGTMDIDDVSMAQHLFLSLTNLLKHENSTVAMGALIALDSSGLIAEDYSVKITGINAENIVFNSKLKLTFVDSIVRNVSCVGCELELKNSLAYDLKAKDFKTIRAFGSYVNGVDIASITPAHESIIAPRESSYGKHILSLDRQAKTNPIISPLIAGSSLCFNITRFCEKNDFYSCK